MQVLCPVHGPVGASKNSSPGHSAPETCPRRHTGYADALSRPAGAPYTHPEPLVPADGRGDSATSSTSGTGFRLPAVGDDPQIPDHAQEHQPEPETSGEPETLVAKVRSRKNGTRKRAAKRPVGRSPKKGR